MSAFSKRLVAPSWGQLPALAVALVCVLVAPVAAQPKGKAPKADKVDKGDRAAPASTAEPAKLDGAQDSKPEPGKKGKDAKDKGPKTYDFNALDLNGRMRSPQLLYFLERANEELERASLEKRSFIPHMVRSLEEEQL